MIQEASIHRSRPAFTLVELLVVVTIIVVLLALLVPAMGRAVYQAQVVKCGANIKAVVAGMQLYAFDHKRYYPDRDLPAVKRQFAIQPQVLAHPVEGNDGPGTYDMRKTLKHVVQINKQLNDPLTQPVDLEWQLAEGQSDTYILGSYHLWNGWKISGNASGMYKLGNRWSVGGHRYSLLMSDMDTRWWGGSGVTSTASHPDMGILFNNVAERAFSPFTTFITVSAWEFWGSDRRKPLDLNYGYDDGSVQTKFGVKLDDAAMDRVPHRSDASGFGYEGTQVPAQ